MMKSFVLPRRSTVIIWVIVTLVFFLTRCINRDKGKPSVSDKDKFSQFAGSAKCAGCHKDIYASHIHTPHYLTSRPASEEYIKGSFAPGENRYAYNASLFADMEKRDSGLFQVIYYQGAQKAILPFNIVVGSGAKGQTYIYWRKNWPLQLPISYFTAAHKWANSPGYPNKVVINRIITSRCLECHTTYAEMISSPGKEPEEFNRDRILFGVDCEKCHGPAASHVEFHLQNPNEKKGRYILNPASFSRQQSLDLCALCHGGQLTKTKPSFSFTAGDALTDYFKMDTAKAAHLSSDNIDVHGNQYGLLRDSKCFIMSDTMTCITCHNTHENERGKIELFSQRCMTCHNKEHGTFCKIKPGMVSSLEKNCIDCHMPKQGSRAIVLQLSGHEAPIAAMIRSHFISIYPGEVKKYMDALDKDKTKKIN
ncbi:MAG: cytochrome c3 family protein [Bacteroidota bacterium]|nr:cytochrome c3 family protein [Bacteroidota bacterium]